MLIFGANDTLPSHLLVLLDSEPFYKTMQFRQTKITNILCLIDGITSMFQIKLNVIDTGVLLSSYNLSG